MAGNSLLNSLRLIRQRVRAVTFLHGLGICLASAMGLLLAAVLADYLFVLPPVGRAFLFLLLGIVLVVIAIHWMIRPLRTPLSLSDIAGRVEQSFPEFDDRIRSTVNFLELGTPGSDALKQRVIDQATELANKTPLISVVRTGPMWISLGGAFWSIVFIVSLGMLAGPGYLSTAINRLSLGDRAWPKRVEIAVDGKMPTRVAVGDRLPIHVHLTKGDRASREAVIEYRYDNGPWQKELMTRDDAGYASSIDARMQPGKAIGKIEIRLSCGDDQRELAPVAIVPRLEIASVDADVLPPPYVHQRRLSSISLMDQPAVVGVGSDVSIRFAFNKPLSAKKPMSLRPAAGESLPASVSTISWEYPSPMSAVAHFRAADPLHFSIEATDEDGFENNPTAEYEVIVRQDQPPTVQIEEPRRSEDRTANAEFDIKAVAEDDYGVDNAQLVVHRLGDGQSQPQNQWTIDLVKNGSSVGSQTDWELTDSTPDHQRYKLQYHWALEQLANANLKPGDVLEYFIQVKDNFDLDGKQHDWVPSGRLRVTIISLEQWDRAVRDELDQTYAAIKQLTADQLRNKVETESLQKEIQRKNKFDNADAVQGERLTNQQNADAAQTAELADRLGALQTKMAENKSQDQSLKQTASDVQKLLAQTSADPMRRAADNLAAGTQNSASPTKDRESKLKESSNAQQAAADALKSAMDRLGNFDGLSDAISTFERIRTAQSKLAKDFANAAKDLLGKRPEELSREDQDKLADLAHKQQDLSKQTESALNDLSRKADALSKSDPTASEGMKQAASAGQAKQVPGKQSQASQSMSQNQQDQASAAHTEIDLGLETILSKLREADRRKLEELARQLDDMQKLLAELIHRQAGHNLDNLWAQGGNARIAKVDAKDLADLFEESGRDVKSPATGADPDQLSASQEQTQRNTADVAKLAAKLPDPTAGTQLTSAAGEMERAIVHLRDEELDQAYDPPQVSALKSLVEARTAVLSALKKAQDELQSQNDEAIRQAYVAMLADQKKIGADMVAVDTAPRDDTGELPRALGVRLGQLPGEQGALADKAIEIGKKLDALGSKIFSWSNQDIVSTMTEVKDDLAKPDTGKPTQAEEQRIEEELQAMIDSLVQHQKPKQFADRSGGGKSGTGSKSPKMPTEAELLLTKALQNAINKATKALDELPDKDHGKLASLADRQGRLRSAFQELVEQAGGVKLNPEPDNRDQLPEEAKQEDVENQELQQQLLKGDASADGIIKAIQQVGDRMARSKQRLGLNDDPGPITQAIQKRINLDLDTIIDLARAQQQQESQGSGSGQSGGQKMQGPGENPGQGSGQQSANSQGGTPGGSKPGQKSGKVSNNGNGDAPNIDLSKQIEESAKEWGGITARERQAVQESAGEKVIEKYKKFVDDYYRSLSGAATNH